MKNNFKAIATKTMIASAIASLMAGAAFAADSTESTDEVKNGSTIITSSDNIKTITNEITSNRVSDENASQKDVGAIYINRIGTNSEAPWELNADLTFANNSSVGKGGAISLDNSSIKLTDAVFTNNTAAGQGGAIRMWAGSGSKSEVTLVYTKDILLSGNKAGIGNDTTLPSDLMPSQGFADQGGFAYLNGANNTLTIEAKEGVAVTIGRTGAADEAGLDSIASNGGAKVNFNGAGTINMNGSMESFVGTITVGEGTTLNMATGFGSFDISAQYAANALDNEDSTPSITPVSSTLNIGTGATVNMNDTLDITASTSVTVNDDAVFNVEGINVVPTTYTDKAGDAEALYEGKIVTTSAGTFTINGTTNVAHDVVVNGTNAGFTTTTSSTGSLDINGNLQILNGSATLGTNTEVANVVVGKAANGEDDPATEGTVTLNSTLTTDSVQIIDGAMTVGEKAHLATSAIDIATNEKGGAQGTLTVNGTLETSSDQIYSVTDDKATLTAGLKFDKNSDLLLTDETFTSTVWDNLETALGGNGTFTFDTATYVATGENETINFETLNKYKRLGHAVVVKNAPAENGETVLNQLTNGQEYTLGAFDFRVASDTEGTDKWNLTVGDADNGTAIFRGTVNGEVFMNAGDATITLNYVEFGQEDSDHGLVSNKVKLGTNTSVNAGTFTFGEVDLNTHNFYANEGSTLTVASVTAKTEGNNAGGLVADGGKVIYADQANEDGDLIVNGIAYIRNGGTYVAGAHNFAGISEANSLYIGQKTTFADGVTFGTEAESQDHYVVFDMASIANSGYTSEDEDSILTVSGDSFTIKQPTRDVGTATIRLINKDKRIASVDQDDEGFNIYTIKVGQFGTSVAEDAELENEGDLFGNEYNAKYSSTDSSVKVEVDQTQTGAYSHLSNENSAAAQAAADALKTWDTDALGLVALTKDGIAQNLGYTDWAEAQAAGVKLDDIQDRVLDASDDVMIGAIASGAFSANFDYTYEVAKTLDRRMSIANLNAARNPSGMTPWVDVFGSANEAKSLFGDSDGHYGYEADIYGAVLGFDWTAPCGAIIGAAVNVGTSDANSVGDFSTDSDADSDYYGISIYGSHRIGNFNGKVDFGYIHSKNDITTKTFFGSFDESLDADIFTFGLGAEYLANVGAFNVVPHAGIRWSRLDMDNSEYGADYDAMNLFQMPMGVTFSGTIETSGMKIAPMIDISVVPAFGDKDAVASFTSGYEETVRVVDTNPVQMTLGVTGQVDAWTFGVNYGLSAGGEDRLNNSFNLNARYTF